MYKKSVVFLLVIIAMLCSPQVFAACGEGGSGGSQGESSSGDGDLGGVLGNGSTSAQCDTPQDFQEAINNGQSVTFNAGTGETFTYKGTTFKGKGTITFKDGKLSGDVVGVGESFIDDVEGMEFGPGGDFTIAQVSRIAINGDIIINGKGIRFEDGHLKADSYDLHLKGQVRTTNGFQLDSFLNKFSIEKADRVESDCVIIPDVTQSNFTNYPNALEIQATDGINITIADCSQNPYDITFESKGGKVIVNKEDPAKYIIEKGILTCSFGINKSDILIANQSASLSMNKDC